MPTLAEQLVRDAVTLFAVLNPFDTIPLYLAVTRDCRAEDLPALARRATLVSAIVLVFFALGAQLVLEAMDIRLGAFKVAGGIVLFLFSLTMIFGGAASRPEDAPSQRAEAGHDLAVFPLAIPSIASPGAMMAAVVLTDDHRFSVAQQAVTIGVMLALLALTYVVLLGASRIQRILGRSGIDVVSRVFGLLLAALAAEMVLLGVQRSLGLGAAAVLASPGAP